MILIIKKRLFIFSLTSLRLLFICSINETPTLNIVFFFFLKNFSKNQQWGQYIGQNDFFFVLHFSARLQLLPILIPLCRAITNISVILIDISLDRLSFVDIVSERPDTRNIDDISQHFHPWVHPLGSFF